MTIDEMGKVICDKLDKLESTIVAKLDRLERAVRDNLQVQTTTNTAVMEIVKAWHGVAASTAKEAKHTLEDVRTIVKEGVVAAAAEAAKLVPDSKHD